MIFFMLVVVVVCFVVLCSFLFTCSFVGLLSMSFVLISLPLSVVRALSCGRSVEVNVLLIVCFVSTLLLSYPFIRFSARLFAYVVTTWAPGLLYRGNR